MSYIVYQVSTGKTAESLCCAGERKINSSHLRVMMSHGLSQP